MTCYIVNNSPTRWSMSREDDGHRTYKLKYTIGCTSELDGPVTALLTPGLPQFGTQWIIGNDVDIWAWCRMEIDVKPMVEKEPNEFFELEMTFSTKPPPWKTCQGNQIEDPLLVPQQIGGSFVRYQKEYIYDRLGKVPNKPNQNMIVDRAGALLHGPQVTFDASRPQVRIQQNTPQLQFTLLCSLADTVNASPLWGFNKRCVKLSEIQWERKFYGTCNVYFTRTFTFDINANTWDTDLQATSTKAIRGAWVTTIGDANYGKYIAKPINTGTAAQPIYQNPDPTHPTDYVRYFDWYGNPSEAYLDVNGIPIPSSAINKDANGNPVPPPKQTPFPIVTKGQSQLQIYQQADFLQLGIPTTLDQFS
jgi:hypothetical protein